MVLLVLLVTMVPAWLSWTVPNPLAMCWILTPSRSWSSWWGGGWAGLAAGGCPSPRCGCPPAGRGMWATLATWGSGEVALLAGHWNLTTWWGRWAPPFWRWVGRWWEKGWLDVWVCCLQLGEQSTEWLQSPREAGCAFCRGSLLSGIAPSAPGFTSLGADSTLSVFGTGHQPLVLGIALGSPSWLGATWGVPVNQSQGKKGAQIVSFVLSFSRTILCIRNEVAKKHDLGEGVAVHGLPWAWTILGRVPTQYQYHPQP